MPGKRFFGLCHNATATATATATAKLIFALLPAIFFASCNYQTKYNSASFTIQTNDFRPYLEKGFLFYPDEYRGGYETIGYFSILATPEVKPGKSDKEEIGPRDRSKKSLFTIDPVDTKKAIDAAYLHCQDLGANAVMHFNIAHVSRIIPGVNLNQPVDCLMITGYAIKRID